MFVLLEYLFCWGDVLGIRTKNVLEYKFTCELELRDVHKDPH